MKTLIFTYAVARSDFITMQYAALKKFVPHQFEYIVFINYQGECVPAKESIRDTCNKLNIRCFDVPAMPLNDTLNWSFRSVVMKEACDLALMTHYDIFPMKTINIIEMMADCDLYGYGESRKGVNYLWPGLLFLNMATLPEINTIDFSGALINGQSCDTGGSLYYYLQAHPELKVKGISGGPIGSREDAAKCFTKDIVEKYDPSFGFQVYEEAFLHYGRGANWDHQPDSFVRRKTALLNEIIARRMADEPIFKGG